jgi:hypothetical protein
VNLMTLPACLKCNNGFSHEEDVVRAILALVSAHPEMVAERQPNGRLSRALRRNDRLRMVIERSRQPDGNYGLTDEVLLSFQRVFTKTVQGLFFGVYGRLVEADKLRLVRVENSRLVTAEKVADELRPSPLLDITDEPLSDITPCSWHSRQPIIILTMEPGSGGPPVQRAFRLTRETPVEWVPFQPGVFSFAFVKREDQGVACVMELWQTLVVAVTAPWPDNRGPMRRGRKNPLSRDQAKKRGGRRGAS